MDFEKYHNDLKLRLERLEDDFKQSGKRPSTYDFLEGSIWQLKQVIIELERFL